MQSTACSNGKVKSALSSLDVKIQAAGAKSVLYMTWARSVAVAPPVQVDLMNLAVSDYYERNAASIGALVAPVGRAWERALRDPTVTLHSSDGSHPNAHGTYLAGCILYATLSGASPLGLGDGGLAIPPAEAASLQQVAVDTVTARQPPAPPLLGAWPLSKGVLGNDIIPSQGLSLGDTTGPGAAANGATQFAAKQFAIAPYFAGINPAALTVSLRVRRADWSVPTTDTEAIAAKPGNFGLWQLKDGLSAQVGIPGVSVPVITTDVSAIAPGWHHVALTYDGAAYILWLDGVQKAAGVASGKLGGGFEPLGIGGQPAAFGSAFATTHFSGDLADVRLYGQALSAAQLQSL